MINSVVHPSREGTKRPRLLTSRPLWWNELEAPRPAPAAHLSAWHEVSDWGFVDTDDTATVRDIAQAQDGLVFRSSITEEHQSGGLDWAIDLLEAKAALKANSSRKYADELAAARVHTLGKPRVLAQVRRDDALAREFNRRKAPQQLHAAAAVWVNAFTQWMVAHQPRTAERYSELDSAMGVVRLFASRWPERGAVIPDHLDLIKQYGKRVTEGIAVLEDEGFLLWAAGWYPAIPMGESA